MSAIDMWNAAPPISRTIAAASFTMSILAYTGIIPIMSVIFWRPYLLQMPPQVWRLFTSFILTGEKLSILLDPYFLYTYGARLERGSPKLSQPGDFLTYIIFIWGVILGLNAAFTGGYVFTGALVLAFTYTACQEERGMKTTFYVITIPSPWVPFAMLLITFLLSGPQAALIAATGLVAAHLHDFLTRLWPEFGGGVNLVPTPGFIRRLFETRQTTVTHKDYGTAHAPPQRQSSTTSGSDVLPDSWKSRGSGRKLGGD